MGNLWESIGVVYLTFFWQDSETQTLFDRQDKTTKQIYDFIEVAARRSESILVHSIKGQSRAASVLACYLMRKYRWSMIKTLEFLNSRRPELEIKASFIQQLQEYEHRLQQHGLGPLSFTFKEFSFRD
jgi:protein-tyrosine phosphatase